MHTVRAKKLVVVSAGTFGSPGVLERSGVGRTEVLNKIGVPVKLELDGVGEGYQGMLALSFADHSYWRLTAFGRP